MDTEKPKNKKTTWAVTHMVSWCAALSNARLYAALEPSALIAVRTSSVNNASRSCASFASILRSTSTPAYLSPFIRALYEIPLSRASALIRAIQSVR